MADSFTYVALSPRFARYFHEFDRGWPRSWRTDSGWGWFFSHGTEAEGEVRIRLWTDFDRCSDRFGQFQYSWTEVVLDVETGVLRIRTDFSSSYPSFVWDDGDSVIISTSLTGLVSILRKLEIPVLLDHSSAYAFLVTNFTPAWSTLIKGVARLSANAEIVVAPSNGSGILTTCFPTLPIFRPEDSSTEDRFDRHLRIFDDTMHALVRHASLKWPIGVMYTGGFDSSVILGWLSEKGFSDAVVAITAVTGGWTTNDDLAAPKIARSLWIRHRVVHLDGTNWIDAISENISSLWDPTEAYGYSMTIGGIFNACPDVNVFLNGSGTDSPIASTHVTLSVLWEWWFGSWSSGFHDMTKPFRSVFTDGRPVFAELEKTVSDVPGFIADFSQTYGSIMNFTGLLPEHMLLERPKFVPFVDKYHLEGAEPTALELLTALDMSWIPHRMSDTYFGISNSKSKECYSPFSSAGMRNSTFSFPMPAKFNPGRYPMTVRDNQYFMKTAFSRYAPKELLTRTKTYGSLPNVRFWLTWRGRHAEVSPLLDSFLMRGLVAPQFLRPLFAFYEKYCRAKESGVIENPDTVRRVTLTLSMVWRICVLEIFMRRFIDA